VGVDNYEFLTSSSGINYGSYLLLEDYSTNSALEVFFLLLDSYGGFSAL
jgi:hypothetical protein